MDMDRSTEMSELYNSACDYIGRLIAGVGDAALLIMEGRLAEALKLMDGITEGLQWMIDAVRLTRDIQAVRIDYMEVNPHMLELVGALEKKDYILTGDLLEYEIKPVLERWRSMMSTSAKP